MLTRKQLELLAFIQARVAADGVPPSFDEMKEALDLKSKSGIHRLIMALEERGFIRRLPNRARALEILRMPDAAKAPERPAERAPAQKSTRFSPSVIEGGKRSAPPSQAAESGTRHSIMLPVMGRIAAGVPISAIQTQSHAIAVPVEMLTGGEHFALEVKGDSMVEAGILDGDTVVIKRQDSANTGDIVVALIDGEEATLKRFRRRDGKVALEAANPAYETRLLPPERVRVQGRLTGLIRRY